MGRKKSVTISFLNDRNKIRLRFRYNGQRYTLSTSLNYTPENLDSLKPVTKKIKADISKGKLDESLDRYRDYKEEAEPAPLIEPKKPVAISPVLPTVNPINKPVIADFEYWTINYRQKDCEKHIDYNSTRNMLKRWGLFKIEDALTCLNKETFNYKTYNRRLNLLHAFFKWGIKHRNYPINPFEDVLPRTGKKVKRPQREPLTQEEITKILDAVKNNTYVSKFSAARFNHSHYYPFLFFMYKTGCRNAEAVGIRVKHIDLKKNLIIIEEAMARNLSKTHGTARIRKETKNGKIRKIPLNPEVKEVLAPLMETKQPDDLLFTSFNGLPIDDRMFMVRILRPILKELEIAERDLYVFRHGFSTRCIASGISPVVTAFMMGNNPETALRNYTHLHELPDYIP